MFSRFVLFYIPFGYSLKTRFNNISAFCGWMLEYLIPISLIVFNKNDSTNIGTYVLAIFYIYNTYEIGYIENDTETIKIESSPSLRLTSKELNYYEDNKVKIYSFKFLFSCLFGVILYLSGVSEIILFYILLLIPVYLCYNRNRSQLNNHLFLLQRFMRYSGLYLIGIEKISILDLLLLLLMYPMPIYITRCVSGKYGYVNHFLEKYVVGVNKNFSLFRIRYSAISVILGVSLLSLSVLDITCFIVLLYYLIYWIIRYWAKIRKIENKTT